MIAPSRYTPSLLPGKDLEDLFVERHVLLDEIMGRVDRASTTDDRTHTLLVGPRGAGKTHLVSLVAHRTRLAIDSGLRAQLVWLPEDLWTVDSYEALAGLIAQDLGAESPIPDVHLDKAIAFLVDQRGTAIVIAENLDEVLHSIGEVGQQRLRRLLSSRDVLLVATTTRLGRAFSDQARPFYGFFTTTKLEPFDVDAAARMLTKLAERDDDDDLVAYLATPTARARLTVVEHLAGGAPRMWATLASALTVDALDQLVELLVNRFDDLTPYYQERLGKLSPQQRKVVARLAEMDRAVSVKDLAADMKLPERSIGKAVNELHGAGWLQPIDSPFAAMVDKRRTYYELAEPMARLAFQLKASRGRPIRLVVEFLKSWFERSDLELVAGSTGTARTYAREALRRIDTDRSAAVAMHVVGMPAPDLRVIDTLRHVDVALA